MFFTANQLKKNEILKKKNSLKCPVVFDANAASVQLQLDFVRPQSDSYEEDVFKWCGYRSHRFCHLRPHL